jgi:GxxExxY protein
MDHGSEVTERILQCAIAVHKALGPGLLESTYEEALCVELEEAHLAYERQAPVPVVYKGKTVGEHRLDLLVERSVVVEIKAVARLDPVFQAQVLTYMKLSGCRIGLLINFHTPLLKQGIKRFVR